MFVLPSSYCASESTAGREPTEIVSLSSGFRYTKESNVRPSHRGIGVMSISICVAGSKEHLFSLHIAQKLERLVVECSYRGTYKV